MFWITWDTLRGCQSWPEQGFGGKSAAAGLSDFLLMSNHVDVSPPISYCDILAAISEENTEFIFNS